MVRFFQLAKRRNQKQRQPAFLVARTKEIHKFKVLKRRKNKNPKTLPDEEVFQADVL
jgi:hypothetical protein